MDEEKIKKAVKDILEAVGENPQREGLKDTPQRVANMYKEILGGIDKNPALELKILKGQSFDEIVLVKDIPFYSLCEHHMLPFHGKAHVAYMPEGNRIVGISKIPRVVEVLSRRLQIQERFTSQIADAINETIKPKGVMVIVEAEHLCVTMRGIKKSGSTVKTSVVRGVFRENEKTRAETLALIKD
ncbi:MAG: GTP cyclohydrolase I FolE [Candidatus Omnitrophica bacterium]|nr:GTP cyclohydrolase I FolE [Candidatus Omnitrophota bacterium]MBU1046995.1 GTP cyclohydrolase I FolE [Candidatus Omnitrophota bacterium]MBU1767272.1 GTP cyclohydrolase I FolE [Candidatus Omnitrophota bacterium]MBU1889541.1 GTP cyclohydrolase I FolE [Candidatus Omnitrophota bacterium]